MSTMVSTGWRRATGATPPIANPVCSRTNSEPARETSVSSSRSATLMVSTRWIPEVRTSKVADLLELTEVSLADSEFVREHTGFAIGGVAPVALLHPVETIVDISLSRYDQVWAAAGHPYTVFPTSYDELLRLTGGHPAEVA